MMSSSTTKYRKEYSELTVPQLKARCKELKLSGYSKLGKAALLEKLAKEECQNYLPLNNDTCAGQKKDAELGGSANIYLNINDAQNVEYTTAVVPDTLDVASKYGVSSSKIGNQYSQTHKPQHSKNGKDVIEPRTDTFTRQKRMNSNISFVNPKKVKTNSNLNNEKNDTSLTIPILTPNSISREDNELRTSPSIISHHATKLGISCSKTTQSSGERRFRPLLPLTKCYTKQKAITNGLYTVLTSQSILSEQPTRIPPNYLDFMTNEQPLHVVNQISMPPSLSQRKNVLKWSIILSAISDKDRIHCCLVSRMFRYASMC